MEQTDQSTYWVLYYFDNMAWDWAIRLENFLDRGDAVESLFHRYEYEFQMDDKWMEKGERAVRYFEKHPNGTRYSPRILNNPGCGDLYLQILSAGPWSKVALPVLRHSIYYLKFRLENIIDCEPEADDDRPERIRQLLDSFAELKKRTDVLSEDFENDLVSTFWRAEEFFRSDEILNAGWCH